MAWRRARGYPEREVAVRKRRVESKSSSSVVVVSLLVFICGNESVHWRWRGCIRFDLWPDRYAQRLSSQGQVYLRMVFEQQTKLSYRQAIQTCCRTHPHRLKVVRKSWRSMMRRGCNARQPAEMLKSPSIIHDCSNSSRSEQIMHSDRSGGGHHDAPAAQPARTNVLPPRCRGRPACQSA